MSMTIILTIVILGVLIAFHELGHFTAAKLADVKVYEFALGMGPKLLSYQYGETQYSLRAIPVGGFVRMAGEEPDDVNEERGVDKKKPATRALIMSAGVIMNFALAVILFSFIFLVAGVPSDTPAVGQTFNDLPAAQAGLKAGDLIVEIEGTSTEHWTDVTREIKQRPGQNIHLVVQRDSQRLEFDIETEVDEQTGEGFIGIGPVVESGSLISSISYGFSRTLWFIKFIFTSLVGMVLGTVAAEGAGPVGIAQMIGQVAQTGVINTLSFMAVLSINVGIFNLLPIPPLDGSRLIFIIVEVIRGRPIDPEKENFIYLVGFALLILFAVLITYQDLQRLNIFTAGWLI